MIHHKTGNYAYLVCTECNKKTKHLHWKHEKAYHTKYFFNLFKKINYKLVDGYECTICHRTFNFQSKKIKKVNLN
jgi:hypothetical protein